MSARRTLAAVLVTMGSLLLLAAAALALPPFTTAPKTATGSSAQAEAYGIATGCHPTFDRFVIDVRAATPGYDVRYVTRVVGDGSGLPIALLGTRRILVVVRNTRGHTQGGANLLPSSRTPLCPNLRQVKKAGDFEGVVSFGLGLRRRTGFRVFRLTAPARLVIDVAH